MNRASPAAGYVALFPALMDTAKSHGYALAVHGSLNRDLDLIAAPWVDEVADPCLLAEAIKAACGGKIYGIKTHKDGSMGINPTPKPHGRLAWTIHLEAGLYLDLSVMPRAK